jgi:hypothetical protein
VGGKDENITPEQARKIVGDKYADKIENLALAIYKAAHAYAVSVTSGLSSSFKNGLESPTPHYKSMPVSDIIARQIICRGDSETGQLIGSAM